MHILSDSNGLPLVVGVSAGNVHDSEGLKPMVEGHQTQHDPYRGRYFKPQRLHADKAYDVPHLRKWLWGKHIGVRIARKGIESSERLGRRRWVIERTMSWLSGYRRLSPRYERHPRNYLAFLGLAAALCCYKRLVRLHHVGHCLSTRSSLPVDPAGTFTPHPCCSTLAEAARKNLADEDRELDEAAREVCVRILPGRLSRISGKPLLSWTSAETNARHTVLLVCRVFELLDGDRERTLSWPTRPLGRVSKVDLGL